MDLKHAQSIALELLSTYRLNDWTFKFDHAKRRFGSCNYSLKQITLSRHLTVLNGLEQVNETLLHEIAHALTPGDHHGKKWRQKCLELGILPERCYKKEDVTQPKAKYMLHCETCKLEVPRLRKSSKIFVCKVCCERYNQGRLSKKYQLVWQLA